MKVRSGRASSRECGHLARPGRRPAIVHAGKMPALPGNAPHASSVRGVASLEDEVRGVQVGEVEVPEDDCSPSVVPQVDLDVSVHLPRGHLVEVRKDEKLGRVIIKRATRRS